MPAKPSVGTWLVINKQWIDYQAKRDVSVEYVHIITQ